ELAPILEHFDLGPSQRVKLRGRNPQMIQNPNFKGIEGKTNMQVLEDELKHRHAAFLFITAA
ncbi:hypothetical protein A2U01_0036860, partial [Trifolium medium]|nr:hypothetical protein [Trifolium medium]